MDEAMAYSAGGNLVYWNHCCDRSAGAIDIAKPYSSQQEWVYFDYNLNNLIPGYSIMYNKSAGSYGSQNGVYWNHGDQNPPIPYKAGYTSTAAMRSLLWVFKHRTIRLANPWQRLLAIFQRLS